MLLLQSTSLGERNVFRVSSSAWRPPQSTGAHAQSRHVMENAQPVLRKIQVVIDNRLLFLALCNRTAQSTVISWLGMVPTPSQWPCSRTPYCQRSVLHHSFFRSSVFRWALVSGCTIPSMTHAQPLTPIIHGRHGIAPALCRRPTPQAVHTSWRPTVIPLRPCQGPKWTPCISL